jgi:hypothetical protein
LEQLQLKNKALETMISVAEKEFKIEIRKSIVPDRSTVKHASVPYLACGSCVVVWQMSVSLLYFAALIPD